MKAGVYQENISEKSTEFEGVECSWTQMPFSDCIVTTYGFETFFPQIMQLTHLPSSGQ